MGPACRFPEDLQKPRGTWRSIEFYHPRQSNARCRTKENATASSLAAFLELAGQSSGRSRRPRLETRAAVRRAQLAWRSIARRVPEAMPAVCGFLRRPRCVLANEQSPHHGGEKASRTAKKTADGWHRFR